MNAPAHSGATVTTTVQPQRRTLRLYDALTALDILDELIEEHAERIALHGGDIEAVPEIAELLAFAEADFEAAVERWALKVRTLTVEADAAAQEAARVQQIASRKMNAAASLKGYLKRMLEARNIAKVATPLVTVRIQKNGGKPAVRAATPQLIEDLYAAGSEFVKTRVEYVLDSDKVLAANAAGDTLPDGITVTVGTHLRVV